MKDYKEKINEFSCITENKLKSFDSVDFSILGITLISVGSLLCLLKKDFFKKIAPIISIISLLGSLYVFIKFSKKDTVPYIKSHN